MDFSDVEVLIW